VAADLLAAAFPGWPHTSAAPVSLIPLDTSPGDDAIVQAVLDGLDEEN
jgi:hypothetical protein